MQSHIKASLTKAQFPTPLYSPRTTHSNHLRQINSLKTNLIINIDKYILANLKHQFDKRGKELTLLELVHFARKYLKDWNTQLYGRDIKMIQCLLDLWKEIDLDHRGRITWEDFNSKIIETSLNLKTLSNNAGIQAPTFKQISVPLFPTKYQNTIAKLIYLKNKNKIAFFRQEAIQIDFFATDQPSDSSPQCKPILLPQQQLKVQTMIKVKEKNESAAGQKVVKHPQKTIKKDLKVSSYKNTVIDSIYLDDAKYDMLMVSSSDKFVRGYNISNILPVISVQPENEDEPMIHQFPTEIYTMAWDSVNQVLYATGKYPKIYQWMIKTDSEREMIDAKGHDLMISVMLMMPKLQLLATGGYDGKLLLWDTVGQVVKCRYQEHTRAVSSITFHEGLILLFTASYDHKICIWNPYITSLIHKIDNTLNVISIQIIPNTNYLMSLDCGGTVKIREINRFTQVASFSIFRSESTEDAEPLIKQDKTDRQLSISMCSKKDGTIHYYFGTQKIIGYEYFQIEKSSILGGNVTEMKYDPTSFKLFTPMKNHVIVWNLLTGRIEQIFYDMTENDITTIEIASELGFFICGDLDGNLVQRKLSNGFLIKNLTKIKSSVNTMKFHEVERNQKQKSLKRTYLLFCTTEQGEITVFKLYPKAQFTLYKQFSIRQDLSVPHGNLVAIQYFGLKNILAIKLNTNELLFVDVEKKSLLIKMEFGEVGIGGMNVIDHKDGHFFAVWNKSAQITGFYLPPHSKKFKVSCVLQVEDIDKPEHSLYAPKFHFYFVSTQNSELYCVKFQKKYLEVDNYTPTLSVEWKIKVEKRIISMMLIQNQKILVILTLGEDITFISVQNGDTICKLRQQIKNEPQLSKEVQPLFHLKEKSNQIYIANEDKIVKISQQQLEQTYYHRILDPSFFINFIKNKNIKNFNKVSSSGWDLNLNLTQSVERRIEEIQQIESKLDSGVEKIFQMKATDMQKKIQKAIELQKKWERQKDFQNNGELLRNQYSMSKLERTSSNFKKSVSRANSISVLWKNKQAERKSEHEHQKQKKQQKAKANEMTVSNSKFIELQKVDLSKLRNDPLYRLGQALKSVNTRDKKADNFIEMARKKDELKLPKINYLKLKP